jgi:hypothetical protein
VDHEGNCLGRNVRIGYKEEGEKKRRPGEVRACADEGEKKAAFSCSVCEQSRSRYRRLRKPPPPLAGKSCNNFAIKIFNELSFDKESLIEA